MKRTIKWGIIGTGRIASTFAADLRLVEGCELVAVASRTLEGGEAFGNRYKIRKSYGSYEALAADPEVDVVYIATPHVFHKENAIMCMRHKKAVLCEKPIGVNREELLEMIQVAKEEQVFLMEGMWTRFKPATAKLKALLEDQVIGEVRFIQSDFGYRIEDDHDPKERILNKALGGGALLDVGVYPIAMVQMIFGGIPAAMTSKMIMSDTDVDLQSMSFLEYPGKKTAIIHSAINIRTRWEVYIAGTKGNILIPNAWFGNTLTLNTEALKEETYTFNKFGSDYTCEIKAVNESLRNGELENAFMTHQDSLDVMWMVDEIAKSK